MSLGVVSWSLFGILYGVLGSVCALSLSLFTRDFVNNVIAGLLSVQMLSTSA